jgi:hypothetical protein
VGCSRKVAEYLADKQFVRNALAEGSDLRIFTKKPSPKALSGICLVLLSYIIGWPAVAALGVISFHMDEPLILVIGGPLVYGLSHLVFLAGMYLAGRDYAAAYLKWAVNILYRKFIGHYPGITSETDRDRTESR